MTDLEIIATEIRAAEVPMSDALAGALERLEALRAENEVLIENCNLVRQNLTRLRAENEKLRTDAERYRWLRAEQSKDLPLSSVVWKLFWHRPSGEWVNLIDGHDLDKHVDAAMQKGDF